MAREWWQDNVAAWCGWILSSGDAAKQDVAVVLLAVVVVGSPSSLGHWGHSFYLLFTTVLMLTVICKCGILQMKKYTQMSQ